MYTVICPCVFELIVSFFNENILWELFVLETIYPPRKAQLNLRAWFLSPTIAYLPCGNAMCHFAKVIYIQIAEYLSIMASDILLFLLIALILCFDQISLNNIITIDLSIIFKLSIHFQVLDLQDLIPNADG